MIRSITRSLLFKFSRGDNKAENPPVSEQIENRFKQSEAIYEICVDREGNSQGREWSNNENNDEVTNTRKQMRLKFKAWNGMSRANKYVDRHEDQGTGIVLEPIKVQKLKLNVSYIRTFLKYSADRFVDLDKMEDSTTPFYVSLSDKPTKSKDIEVLFRQIEFSGNKVCNFFKQVKMAGSNECTDEANFDEVLGDLLDWIGYKVILKVVAVQLALSQSPQSFASSSSVCLLVEFIESLKKHLKELQWLYNHLEYDTEILERKLVILKTICIASEFEIEVKRNHLLGDIQALTDRVAYLSYSGLVSEFDGDMFSRMSSNLFELLAKEAIIIGETSGSDLIDPVMDDIEDSILTKMDELKQHTVDHLIAIKEELLLVRYFLMDMANEYDELMELKSIFYNAKVEIFKNLCSLCGSNLTTESLTETLGFVKLLIRHIYHQIPEPSLIGFSNTFELGSFDFFLENLKALLTSKLSSIALLKPQQIETLQEYLVVLRSFLNEIHHRINLNQELQDLQVRILSVAMKMEYIVNGLVGKFGGWHKVMWFNDVMRDIISIRSEVGAFSGHNTFHIGCSHDEGNTSSHHGTSHANSLRSDDEIIGFKDEEAKILEQLLSGSRQMKLLSIVGMPGLGKTTLAKRVYNNPIISDCFYVRAWCCISQVHQEEELLVEILKQIVNSDGKEAEFIEDELAAKVHKGLKGQKYLIVVDDIWETKLWVNVRRSFPDDNNGSRILFTSRSHGLSLGNKIKTHHLRPFSDDESFALLNLKLSQREIYYYDSSLAKRIANKCKGLPLAVVIVAGLLPTDTDATYGDALRQWKEVEGSLSSYVVDDILELGYRRLPYHLKPCLLYIGAHWNNGNIPIQEVLWMWIAEGFVENSDPKRSEEKARSYLMDLIHRSLIFIGERRSLGGIKACYLHDLVRDFCISKAEEEKFLHLPDIERFEQNRTRISLRFAADNGRWPSIFVRSLQIKFLLVHESEKKISSLILRLKFLRVLKLEACSSGSYLPLPDDIGSLIHLRYLGGCFTSVPSSISNLRNLQALILNSTDRPLYSPPEAIHLPPTLWNMVNLQHLIIGCRFLFDQVSSNSSSLLDNLQSLSTPLLSYGDHTEMTMMQRCPNLRKLCCVFLTHQWDSTARRARFPVLDFLNQLESLKVSYGGVDRLNAFPRCEFSLPSSIKKLTLSKFCLSWNKISIFGKLPNLEVLKLLDDAFVGEEWNTVDEEFLKLKYLKLEDLEIETWNVSYDHFPRLERLVIKKCYYLKEVPSSFGEISTLRVLELFQADSELRESAHLIKKEQEGWGNEDLVVLIH